VQFCFGQYEVKVTKDDIARFWRWSIRSNGSQTVQGRGLSETEEAAILAAKQHIKTLPIVPRHVRWSAK
jgi:hypothetical protein